MKKSIFIIGCLALLMAGCNKVEMVEAPVEEPAVEAPEHLIVDITIGHEGDTRAVKKAWEAGDKVYVAFDHYFSTNNNLGETFSDDVLYMTLTYDGYKWTSAFSNSALETYLLGRESGDLVAIYYSDFVPEFQVHSRQSGRAQYTDIQAKNFSSHPGFFLYDASDDDHQCVYTVQNGKLTASLSMHTYANSVHFFVPGLIRDPLRYSLQCDKFYASELKGFSVMWNKTYDPPTISHQTSLGSLPAARHMDGAAFSGVMASNSYPGQGMEYVIQIIDNQGTSDNTDDVTYTLTKTATLWGNDAVQLPPITDSRWVKSWVVNSGTVNGHNWVRMGDGTKWATENVTVVPGSISFDQKYYYSWSKANWTTLWEGWRVPSPEEWRSLGRGYHTFEHVYVGGYIASRVRASNTGQQLYLPGWGALDEDLQSLVALKEYDPVTYQPIYEINPYGFYWTNYNNEASGGTHYAFITDVEGSPVRILSDEADGSWDASYMAVRLVVDE